MKKLAIVFALIFLSAHCVWAQERPQNRFEIGLGYDYYPGHTDGGVDIQYHQGLSPFFEWRHQVGKHWDFGAKVDTRIALAQDGSYKGTVLYGGLHAVADVNILPGRGVNPFIGIEAGPGIGITNVGYTRAHFLVTASARMGLEIARHFRVSLALDLPVNGSMFFDTNFTTASVNLGWAF